MFLFYLFVGLLCHLLLLLGDVLHLLDSFLLDSLGGQLQRSVGHDHHLVL